MTQKDRKTKIFDYRGLYKTLERTLYAIEHSEDLDSTLAAILEGIVTEFREELGFSKPPAGKPVRSVQATGFRAPIRRSGPSWRRGSSS